MKNKMLKRAVLTSVCVVLSASAIAKDKSGLLEKIKNGGFEGDTALTVKLGTLGLGDTVDIDRIKRESGDKAISYVSCRGGCDTSTLALSCYAPPDVFIKTKAITSYDRDNIISSVYTKDFRRNLQVKGGVGELNIRGIRYRDSKFGIYAWMWGGKISYLKGRVPYPGVSVKALESATLEKFGEPDYIDGGSGAGSNKVFVYTSGQSKIDKDFGEWILAEYRNNFQRSKWVRLGYAYQDPATRAYVERIDSLDDVAYISVGEGGVNYILIGSVSDTIRDLISKEKVCIEDRVQKTNALLLQAEKKASAVRL